MRNVFIILLLFLSAGLIAQDAIKIEDCLGAAVTNHPRSADVQLLENIGKNRQMNTQAAWKPKLDLNGQASYQSDVIEFNVELPIPGVSFPSAPKDQYKLYLELQQTIYDGGRIKQKKVMEELGTASSVLEVESSIETVKSEVIDLYYSILALQESRKIQEIMMELLEEKSQLMKAGISNGLFMEADLSLVEIEILDLEQEIRSLDISRNSLIDVLSVKCGMELDSSMQFANSDYIVSGDEIKRKELELFSLKRDMLDAGSGAIQKNRLPVVFAFGQAGVGNPGLNMLNQGFDSYYYVGAGLKWNIWDWNISKREKENLVWQSGLVNNTENEFREKISQAAINQKSRIKDHSENIASLEKLLEKRQEIEEVYESQLNEGTIRTIDYLAVVNQLKITKIKLLTEEISLQRSIAYYNYLTGQI